MAGATDRVRESPEQARWLDVDELAAWRGLMNLIQRLPAALGEQLQQDSQLSFIEYYVLAMLSDAPERRERMSTLALLVNSELSRLSHLMRRLESRGYVRRESDARDRRVTMAVLTDAGYASLAAAAPGHVDRVRELLFDVLDPSEIEVLRSIACKVGDHLGERL